MWNSSDLLICFDFDVSIEIRYMSIVAKQVNGCRSYVC